MNKPKVKAKTIKEFSIEVLSERFQSQFTSFVKCSEFIEDWINKYVKQHNNKLSGKG